MTVVVHAHISESYAARVSGRRLKAKAESEAWKLLKSILDKYRTIRLKTAIRHVCGKSSLNYSQDELVAICVVRNGGIYINSFIKYYFDLGVEHIVFLDNG